MSGLESPTKKTFAQKYLPKEVAHVFKSNKGEVVVPPSPSSVSTGPRRTEASLSPKFKRRILDRARVAKETVRYRYEEGTKRASAVFWLILISTAVLSSALSYSIDQATWSMGIIRQRFTNLGNYDELTMVIIFNVSCVLLARLLVRTTVEAEGSGFPEVKAMLFGKVMNSYLSMRVLFVKACALALGVGAGLPLGKEGPNVHMAACISRTIGPQFYKKTGTGQTVAGIHLLLAACAVGVGSSFSAPIGGVVFSLELVLPQVFDYIGYTGCFLSAVTGSVCFAAYRTWTAGATGLLPLMSTDVLPTEGAMSGHPFGMILLDISIGIFCGLMGGLWIRTHAKVVGAFKRWRVRTPPFRQSRAFQRKISGDFQRKMSGDFQRKMSGNSMMLQRKMSGDQTHLAHRLLDDGPSPKAGSMFRTLADSLTPPEIQWRDLFQIAVVVVLNTIGAASLPLLGGRPQPALLSYLFDKNLALDTHIWSIPSLGEHATMFSCFIFKFFITIFSLSLPNPAGVVAPAMVIGGLLGRCIGMCLPMWFIEGLLLLPGETAITEDQYGAFMARLAILGAASFCAAVCRAFAMAITVFEVLALPNALLPLCSSSLAAMFTANRIALPYFDTNLVGRGLGGISALTHTKKAQDAVFTIMRRVDTRIDCLEEKTTLAQLRKLYEETDETDIPIIRTVVQTWADEGVQGVLKGTISREDLALLLERLGGKSPTTPVDMFETSLTRPSDGGKPLVRCTPTHVDPDALIQDVYLIMKITHTQVVFVTRDNCVLGVINFKELLGHHLN